MDSTDLTREQAERLHATMSRLFQYFKQLERRLEQLQFDRADRFFRLVYEAHDLLQSLSVETHYMSCDGGVCRRPRRDASQLARTAVVDWNNSDPAEG